MATVGRAGSYGTTNYDTPSFGDMSKDFVGGLLNINQQRKKEEAQERQERA